MAVDLQERGWFCVSCGFPADIDVEGEPYCLTCFARDSGDDPEGGDDDGN